jgi:hypothetical protein
MKVIVIGGVAGGIGTATPPIIITFIITLST